MKIKLHMPYKKTVTARTSIKFLTLLMAAQLLAFCSFSSHAEEKTSVTLIRNSIDKSLQHLIKKQRADGAWASETYGMLKPGVATTALILELFSRLPLEQRKPYNAALDKAILFLKSKQDKKGGLGTEGDWDEFSTYSTALTLAAVSRLTPANPKKPNDRKQTLQPWINFLKAAQHTQATGCPKTNRAFGGWRPLGIYQKGLPRRADISSTRFVLEAMLLSNLPKEDTLWADAQDFVFRCQNFSSNGTSKENDGGFYFTTTHPEFNKSIDVPKEGIYQAPSYGSATADGWRCLQILKDVTGHKDLDERIKAATKWFDARSKWDHCPGFEGTAAIQVGWNKALLYYYRAARAQAERHASTLKPKAFWIGLAHAVIKTQGKNGAWVNKKMLMKENDPLIATTFALQVLIQCQSALSK